MLGEFEYLLITAATRLGEEAYGAAIRREIEDATGHRCSIGALYTTLDRLQIKGLVKTWMGEATPQRGGRAKRMLQVTGKGVQAETSFYRAVTRARRDVSWGTALFAGLFWIRCCAEWWMRHPYCWTRRNAMRCAATSRNLENQG